MGCYKCPENKWYLGKKRSNRGVWVWKFGDIRNLNETKASMAKWNPSTGSFRVWLNLFTEVRYSSERSTDSVDKELKKVFKVEKSVCWVSKTHGSTNHKGEYATRVEWYSNLDKKPTARVMERLRSRVTKVMKEMEFVAKVIETGCTETYTTKEVDAEYPNLYYWLQYNESSGKRSAHYGRYWKMV